LNYEDYQERLRQAAARTRQVEGLGQPLAGIEKTIKTIKTAGYGGIGGMYGGLAQTALENYKSQEADQKKKAERAASALEMVGTSTLSGIKNLESAQASVRQAVQSASDTWGMAAEKADEYVKASRGRVGEVLTKLDEIQTSINKDRDFTKAHAMQASVQAAIGSMRGEERNITETYGTDSKEYQQFQASKMSTLATVQSNIHTSYQQLREEQNKTYMNAFADVGTKMNMYIGYQEQQHVEMLKYQSQAKSEYALQEAGFQVSVEQMKMAGMENLANWIIETPTFTMDSTPLVALISDMAQTVQTLWDTHKYMKRTSKSGSTGAATALGALQGAGIGFLSGGPVGAVAGGLVGGVKGNLQSKV
jgi:DNA repair exonuclease SbcCD ATPase subunit